MGLNCQLLSHLGDQTGQTGELIGSGSEDDCLFSTPAVISEVLFHATIAIGCFNMSVIFMSGAARAVHSNHRADSLFRSGLKEHVLSVSMCQVCPFKTSKPKIFP